MNRKLFVMVLVLAACGPGAPSSNSNLRSPAPNLASTAVPASNLSGPWAVMVQMGGPDRPYEVQLVGLDGLTHAGTRAKPRSSTMYFTTLTGPPGCPCNDGMDANYLMPEVSVSSTRVYFLDGDSDVKSLELSGAVSLVTRLEVGPNANAVFAVSPDDRRIAVAVINYKQSFVPPTVSLHMYFEDLVGGGNRVEIFDSTSVVEWPVGWHGGNLVVAVGRPDVEVEPNPYAAVEYHLVDPTTGRRLAALTCNYGPLVAAGSACWKSSMLGKEDWSGGITPFPVGPVGPAGSVDAVEPSYLDLSPDGTILAAEVKGADGSSWVTELFRDGSESLLARGASPLGWLDRTDLIVVSPSGLQDRRPCKGHYVSDCRADDYSAAGLPVLLRSRPGRPRLGRRIRRRGVAEAIEASRILGHAVAPYKR